MLPVIARRESASDVATRDRVASGAKQSLRTICRSIAPLPAEVASPEDGLAMTGERKRQGQAPQIPE